MKLSVRYFASIREAIGQGSEAVDTAAATLGELRDELIARGGAHATSLARGRAVRVALDQVMSTEDAALREGAEVAFFRPSRAVEACLRLYCLQPLRQRR